MNKSELIKAMAERTGLTQGQMDNVLGAFQDVVADALKKGDSVQLVGFGTFEKRERGERKGVNPRTKEAITIPATTVPAFKAGKLFKEAVR